MGAKARSLIGTIYMGLLDANKQLVGGYKQVGNVYPFKIKVETDQKGQTSRMKETAGQTLDAVTRLKTNGITGSLDIHQWIPETLAWALMGEAVALTAGSGAVDVGTPESVTAVLDEFVRLAHGDVSSVVVKDDTDTTTYVAGTDYEVNAALGMIKALSTGDISDDDVLHVSYSYAAETGYQVNIGTKSLIRVAVLIDGEDEFTGEACKAEFYSVVLASGTEIGVISEPENDHEVLSFSTIFETPSGKSTPGTINGLPL